MVDIVIKDALRAAVETASNGEQTVLYTNGGQPTYMNVVPTQTLGQLFPNDLPGSTETHPAFLINGKTLSRLFIGTYPGVMKNGEIVSQPGAPRNSYYNFSDVINALSKQGAGHHMMTYLERGLLIGLCTKNLWNPLAANAFGWCPAVNQPNTKAIRTDGKYIDVANTANLTKSDSLVGSGPASWRHNGKVTGISDLHYNYAYRDQNTAGIGYFSPGMRLFCDEHQFLTDNGIASSLNITDWQNTNTTLTWKAVDAKTGNFITPTSTGKVGVDLAATTPNSVRVVQSNKYPGVWGLRTDMPANTVSFAWDWAGADAQVYNISQAAVNRLIALGYYASTDFAKMKNTSGFQPSGTCYIGAVPNNLISANIGYNMFASIYGGSIGGDGSDITNSSNAVRPCFYNQSDLS